MSNKLKISLALALVIVVGIVALAMHNRQQFVGSVTNGPDGATTNYTSLSVVNGITNGGLFTTVSQKTALTAATTTPCAILSPNSTSTLVYAQAQITTSTTTATTWTLAKATSAYATTTYVDSMTLGSGAQGTLVSIATTTGSDIKEVVAPSTYVVWGVAGIGNLTSDKLLGSCVASFQVAQ